MPALTPAPYEAENAALRQRVAELEDQLAARQATLQGFYDSAPFMMGAAELAGDNVVIVSANRAAASFLAAPLEDQPDQTGVGLRHHQDLERVWVENFRRCLRVGAPVRFEYQPPQPGERWRRSADLGAAMPPRPPVAGYPDARDGRPGGYPAAQANAGFQKNPDCGLDRAGHDGGPGALPGGGRQCLFNQTG